MASQRILIGGGSGFIGTALSKRLASKGYAVTHISRTKGANAITWQDVEHNGIPDVDAVVQLSGANILDKRWTPERKKEIWDSRIKTTESLVKAMAKSTSPPKVFVCGSAVGIYPLSLTAEFDENSKEVADNFAGELVSNWEKASQLPTELQEKTRQVSMRTGVVLGKDGGILGKMMIPFKFGLGGRLGSGNQYMPWIHLDDLVDLHVYAIEHENAKGPLNAVAPENITNSEFTAAFGKALHRPTMFPMPEFVVKTLFGEGAFLVLEGQKVNPKRTLESGFQFKYPTIDKALADLTK